MEPPTNFIKPICTKDPIFNEYNIKFTGLGFIKCLIPKRYEVIKEIESGSQGVVLRAYDNETDTDVAIKKLMRPFKTKEDAKRSYHEFGVLSVIKHKNVTQLFSAYTPQNNLQDFDEIYFVTEFMEQSLYSIIHIKNVPMTHKLMSNLIYQILCGVKYLGDVKIVHRDLKPQNIVAKRTDDGYLLKIIDYGLSINQSHATMSNFKTTDNYQAPETLIEGVEIDSKVDVWSVGCIFSELIKHEVLFKGHEPRKRIFQLLGTPNQNFINQIKREDVREIFYGEDGSEYEAKEWDTILSNEMFVLADQEFNLGNNKESIKLNAQMARNMISKMLKIDPEERYTVENALEDSYVNFWSSEQKEEKNVRPLPSYKSIINGKKIETLEEWKEALYNKLHFYMKHHDVFANVKSTSNFNYFLKFNIAFNSLWDSFTEELPNFNQFETHFVQIYNNQPNDTHCNCTFKKHLSLFENYEVQFKPKVCSNDDAKLMGFEFIKFNKEFEKLEIELDYVSELYLMQIFKPYNEKIWTGKKFKHTNDNHFPKNLNEESETKNIHIIITPTSICIKSNDQEIVKINELSIGKVSIKECDKYFYLELYPTEYTYYLTHFCIVFATPCPQEICSDIKFELSSKCYNSGILISPSTSNLSPKFQEFSILNPEEEYSLNTTSFHTTILYKINNPRLIPANQVAVKEIEKFPAYLREVKNLLMCDHKNIIKAFGCFEDFEQYYLVMEYLKGGTLKEYLMDHDKPLIVKQDFDYLHQILNGMCYLVEKGIMHRYLAACNCFLTENYETVKIGEFVLSRQATHQYNYKLCFNPLVPFRWMAIDFLKGEPYNERMDVWSFAVLAWEIFSRQQKPYQKFRKCHDLVNFLDEGGRLEKPEHCPSEVYDLMLKCWNSDYKLRPTFEQLRKEFNNICDVLKNKEERQEFGFDGEISGIE